MIEESVVKTKAIFSDDKTNRYLLVKEWDESKFRVAVIMLVTGTSTAIIQDVTTTCIMNCVSKLGYGSVEITNLYSKLNTEIETDMDNEKFTDGLNDKYILESVERVQAVVLGWGKADTSNLKIKYRVNEVMALLESYKGKMYLIGDGRGKGYSAMYPKVRNEWKLIKAFEEVEHVEKVAEEAISEQKGKKGTKRKG